MRVVVEIGPKGRRVVAGAIDWPGLDRSGSTDDLALERLATYRPRYARVAELAGKAEAFAAQDNLEVVERYPGNTSTDFWGIAHVPSGTERDALPADDLEHRLAVLEACWAYFDDTVARIQAELRPGARSAGRTREQIIRHVYLNEPEQFSRKVGVRTPIESVLEAGNLAGHRAAYLDALRTYNAEGRMAGRTWTVPFLIRRTAHHVMDHAWEMEDRDHAS
jgi:hypothetical protein